MSAREEERRRVACEIHDETLPALATAILLADRLRGQVTAPDALETLHGIDRALEETVVQLRRLIGGLRPPGLAHGRLLPAIMEAARNALGAGLAVSVTGELSAEPEGTAREMLFRITQEALANCRHHAEATHVEVHLADSAGGVRVTVRDDGEGFDAADVAERPAPGHLGMIGMRERAELVGGRWRVESRPGAGTLVDFWIPRRVEATGGSAP